ncbi:MAG: DUF2163 domain-containing protein [Asticcacaulis sp.]
MSEPDRHSRDGTAWVLRRTDGVEAGFCDLDADVTVAGVVCRAGGGWRAGAASTRNGEAGQAAVVAHLGHASLSAADLAAGLYDGASLRVFRVRLEADGQVTAKAERAGTIIQVVQSGDQFTAALEGPLARLEAGVGRRYGRLCDAVLGDGRCRADPARMAQKPSCDKRFRTCEADYGNGLNFQGFPFLPGEDFLWLYPREGQVMDGGRR